MKRNTLYIVFLVIVLILVCIYASSGISESFITLSDIYARKDGINNLPCDVLKIGISTKDLEDWFIGKTVTSKIDTGDGTTVSTTETTEKPKIVLFLEILKNMKDKCKFIELNKHLDDVYKSKEKTILLAGIVNDIRSILNKAKTIMGELKTKYNDTAKYVSNCPPQIDGFQNNDLYLTVQDINEENIDSGVCTELEKIALKKYLTMDNLKYTHRTINGLERLLCECHDKYNEIGESIGKILEEKHTNSGGICYTNVQNDIDKILKTLNKIDDLFSPEEIKVNSIAVELNITDALKNS